MNILDKLFAFLDKHSVVATVVLAFICNLTWVAVLHMLELASVEPPSLERAAVIAAVLTPIAGLMAGAITFYNKRKDANGKS